MEEAHRESLAAASDARLCPNEVILVRESVSQSKLSSYLKSHLKAILQFTSLTINCLQRTGRQLVLGRWAINEASNSDKCGLGIQSEILGN